MCYIVLYYKQNRTICTTSPENPHHLSITSKGRRPWDSASQSQRQPKARAVLGSSRSRPSLSLSAGLTRTQARRHPGLARSPSGTAALQQQVCQRLYGLVIVPGQQCLAVAFNLGNAWRRGHRSGARRSGPGRQSPGRPGI